VGHGHFFTPSKDPKMTDQTTDFSAYLLDESSTVDIDLPNGEPMLHNGQRVSARVHSPSAQAFIDAKTTLDREAAKNMAAAFGVKQKANSQADKDADAKFLTAVTIAIENFPYPGGVAAVYKEPRLKYIADQVRAHLGDLGNFFPGSAKA